MKKTKIPLTILLVGAVAIFLVGFALALVLTNGPAPSAAATIRRTLIGLLVAPIALGGAAVLLKQWWERYQKRQRYEEQMQRAEILRRLQGSAPRFSQPRQQEQEHGDTIQEPLMRMLQCGAGVGIHVVAATEQPRIVSEYGFPVRVVGRVADTSEAHVASGRRGSGAERLQGQGDFIAVTEGRVTRFQAAHVTPEEIRSTVEAPPPQGVVNALDTLNPGDRPSPSAIMIADLA